jgi:hypothetical protein
MADLDLIDLLVADHQNLMEVDDDHVVTLLSQHLSLERDLLYQAITEFCPDGERTAERLRSHEGGLEQAMAQFESSVNVENGAALDEALRAHIDELESLFPELRKSIPDWWLTGVLDMVPVIIGTSPTHGHRHLGESGPIGEMREDLSSITDWIRDRRHRKKNPPATEVP